jgi:hypothetical protein
LTWLTESASNGAPSNAASSEHETSSRQGSAATAQKVPPEPAKTLNTDQEGGGGGFDNRCHFFHVRRYRLKPDSQAQRNAMVPKRTTQRLLKLNTPQSADHERNASRVSGIPLHAAGNGR